MRAGLFGAVAFAVALAWFVRGRALASVSCADIGRNAVVVDTTAHVAALCEAGTSVATFSVRLGRHGVGKAREGDGKTPLGRYALGPARPSASYRTFVPIGYPTDAQRASGLTGGAIGLHGPDRRVRWAGSWVNAFDTTDGCVGLATDEEMARVVEWTKRTHAGDIILR